MSSRRFERLIRDAAVIGGLERWRRRLRALDQQLSLELEHAERDPGGRDPDAVRRERSELAALCAFSLPLLAQLDALPERAPLGEWLGALQALARRALAEPDTVLATLAELHPLAELGPIGIDELSRLLAPRLSEIRQPPRGSRAGRVFCGSIDDVRGLSFDVVCVLGLCEKVFPAKVVEDAVLPDAARRAFAPWLVENNQRVAEERLRLRVAVGAARTRLLLSYPRVDLERGRPRVPSFYGLEVLRAAEGELPGYDALMRRAERAAQARVGWPAPDNPELSIDETEHDLAWLASVLRDDDSAPPGAARYLLSVNPHLARALRFRARRWSVRPFTAADGLVQPSDAARAWLAAQRPALRAYAPTVLESYAACPYRFALRALYGLSPRSAPTPLERVDPRERGALMHATQQRTVERLHAADLLPLSAERLPQARALLAETLREQAAAFAERLAPVITRVFRDAVDALGRDLERWLERLGGDGFVPEASELGFGLRGYGASAGRPQAPREPVQLSDGSQLTGSIDSVEARGSELRATDYKSGPASTPPGMVVNGGRSLQPLLYALALEQLRPGDHVSGGRLYYCTAEGGYEERLVPLNTHTRALALQVTAEIDQALERGFLPAAPAPGACAHCDYLAVCGPYEEQRTSHKDRGALVTLTRLRELP